MRDENFLDANTEVFLLIFMTRNEDTTILAIDCWDSNFIQNWDDTILIEWFKSLSIQYVSISLILMGDRKWRHFSFMRKEKTISNPILLRWCAGLERTWWVNKTDFIELKEVTHRKKRVNSKKKCNEADFIFTTFPKT